MYARERAQGLRVRPSCPFDLFFEAPCVNGFMISQMTAHSAPVVHDGVMSDSTLRTRTMESNSTLLCT